MRGVLLLLYGCLLLPALVAGWCLPASARELEWRSLVVDARLDDEGRLHVREQHEMVFTGDWKGGERRFRVGDDQSLRVESVARLDADGSWVPLTEGSLEELDHWSYREPALRWRVTRQSDGELDGAVFVHRIDYVLSGALRPRGNGSWRLDHDFAFRERPGDIEQFRLEMTLDNSWQSKLPSPIVLERGPLPPGEGVVVRLPLEYRGARLQDPPSAGARAWESVRVWLTGVQWSLAGALQRLRSGLTADARLWVAAVFSTLLGGLANALLQRARERGHFEPLRAEVDIDAPWIERHILPHPPEVIGAIYDGVVGREEVMAVLARLEREGKLASSVEDDELHLELRVPRDALAEPERELVDKLFFAGDHTSTAAIRSHYTTFDPAAVLRRSLSPKVDAVLGTTHRNPEDSPFPINLAPFVAGAGLMASGHRILESWSPAWAGGLTLSLFLALTIGVPLGAVRARRFRDHLDPPRLEARFIVRWFTAFGTVIVLIALLSPPMAPIDFLTHFGSAFSLALLVVWSGWPRHHAAGVALRKRIAEARRYFQAQLRSPRPGLDDAWYPYMVALGLTHEVNTWLSAFGTEPRRKVREERSTPSHSSAAFASASSSSDDAEPARWTGGGGRFGGGGASGSWGSLAAELATGVSRSPNASSSPSSSSSWSTSSSRASSSSESTSRSGGGSGGGW